MRVFLRKKIDIVGPDAAGYRDTPQFGSRNHAKKAGILLFVRSFGPIRLPELTPSP